MADVRTLFSIAIEGNSGDLKDLEGVFDFFNDFGGEIEHFRDDEFIAHGAMITPERMDLFRNIDVESDGSIDVLCKMDDTYSADPVCLIYSNGQGNVDAVAAIVQDWLKEKGSEKGIALQWAETCSKPIPDNFGGGAVWITANEIDTVSSHEFIHEKKRAAEAAAEADNDTPGIG